MNEGRTEMKIKECRGIGGDRRDYILYGKAQPPFESSDLIEDVLLDRFRYHCGEGDMWPLTWGEDDNIYAAAGDNKGVPMNLWKVSTLKNFWNPTGKVKADVMSNSGSWTLDMINEAPVDVEQYCTDPEAPFIKPAGILDVDGVLYLAVEAQNYGDKKLFNRQRNLHGWIVTSKDCGRTFDQEATRTDFFSGRLSSCHFLQFGRGYRKSRDHYVYAYFPCDLEDGWSYWENNDALLLGRVPRDRILDRSQWEFCSSTDQTDPIWSKDDQKAIPVFCYPKMTGANHVAYNPGLGRYIIGNYSFVDEELHPRPVHQMAYPESHISQLTLYEAPEPWGPWKLFYRDDNWGTYGDYQPNFPVRWMSEDGKILFMVSSGSWDDYNFVVQKIALKCRGDREFPDEARYFRMK